MLHPFSLAEILKTQPPEPDAALKAIEQGQPSPSSEAVDGLRSLLRFGGFPEPFLGQSERRAHAWRRLRLQQLMREDLRDLSKLPELGSVELLMALLPECASSQLSRSSLREDLEVAHTTITRWLSYLSALFYHFEIKPFCHSIKRSLKKEGKLYLWDYAEVPDQGHRFENLVAHHLLKACHYWTDAGYGTFTLSYLRNADGAEIDILIVRDGKPWLPVETKLRDAAPSPHWRTFLPQISCSFGVQAVLEPSSYYAQHQIDGQKVLVMDAARFLGTLL